MLVDMRWSPMRLGPVVGSSKHFCKRLRLQKFCLCVLAGGAHRGWQQLGWPGLVPTGQPRPPTADDQCHRSHGLG